MWISAYCTKTRKQQQSKNFRKTRKTTTY